ncbi:DUF3027 domain-containing protein [Amnibacterium sp.]|uniref:DUF3027 domain-containing protein n=1 Tax=Amnibacterium sp. TaxID=1872496 RepID=UPI00262E4363|nr:DUF3027 domain-containing protein [Amnibacterium sp.]MCU1472864.1 hypothetical protein [Amnibacterium sp.]
MSVLQDDRTALALQALAEVTDPTSVGELIEVTEPAPGVRDLVFACRLPGYVAWRWTVSTTRIDDGAPTVLEVELVPGEGALVAPPWVPWAERLAEYRRTHPDEPVDGPEDLDDDDDEDDEEDLDEDLDDVDADALELDGVEFEDLTEDDDEPTGDEQVDVEQPSVEQDGEAEPADGGHTEGRPDPA